MEPNRNQEDLATAFNRPYSEITREEKLWYLRTKLERRHQDDMGVYSVWRVYEPPIDQPIPAVSDLEFTDLCNKSVSIYILRGYWRFARILHNYIYRRWFKPYESEIEYGRFIGKFIAPKDIISPTVATIQSLMSLNKAICAEINDRRQEYIRATTPGTARFGFVKDQQNYILQPLFQALFIVINPIAWNGEDSTLIGRLPVIIVLTGVDSGLSAPITFESISDKSNGYITQNAIEITLEIAIDFVMGLEAREAKAFGLQPDPVRSWDPDACCYEWRDIMPDDQLIGPTSLFVDTEKYPKWDMFSSAVMDEQRELLGYARWQSQQHS